MATLTTSDAATLSPRHAGRRPIRILLLLAALLAMAFACGPGLSGSAPAGFAFGAVTHGYTDDWDTGPGIEVVNNEFNAVTATAYMAYIGWGGPNQPINTAGLTDVIDYAKPRQKRVHGHVLVYPAANQDLAWFQNPNVDHETVLKRYVDTMALAGAGDVWVWDVVNEVLADPGDSRRDQWGLRNDFIEYSEIGADYVDEAFRWAAAADPDAELIINDYGAEELGEKSDNLFAYVKELRRRGVPIDGVGFQMHINGADGPPDYTKIRDNFTRFANAGFDIYITELDVTAVRNPAPNPQPTTGELEAQAAIYQNIAAIAVTQPRVKSLLLWDYIDGNSWLHPTDRVLGGIPIGSYTYPTPWAGGANGEPVTDKPAVEAIRLGLTGVAPPPTLTPLWERITNDWLPGSGSLTRVGEPTGPGGTYEPTDVVNLHSLAADAATWTSNQWRFEAAGNGLFRIRNRWFGATGYLTRLGEPDGDGFIPTDRVHLTAKDVAFSSQLWQLEAAANGRVRLVNQWEPESGYLTRLGRPDPANPGDFTASNQVHLTAKDPTFTSQLWRRINVNQDF